MTLQLFGFNEHPHDIGVTKIDVSASDCVFFLDFSRPLSKLRQFGILNNWIGPTVALVVPVVHQGEQCGSYVFSVHRSNPYFGDIQKLWADHFRAARDLMMSPAGGSEIVADFGKHFPEDSQCL